MAAIETKVFGLSVHKEQVSPTAIIEIPTAYEQNLGEKLYLQGSESNFKWVRIQEGKVQELNNPVPSWVKLNPRIFFTTRRFILR